MRLTLPTPQPRARRKRLAKAAPPDGAVIRRRAVWFEGRSYDTPLYDRARLLPGTRLRGPAVVAEYTSTTVVPPDYDCLVDGMQNLVLKRLVLTNDAR
jgi:N-methylhydantoinase A